MTDSDARQQLLSALYKRGIDLGTDDVNWAFESQKTKTELSTWIREYLDSSTLLTRDELDLYKTIQGRAVVDNPPSETVPLQEFDIKDAIDSLKSSTAAIEKHSKALEVQRGALLALKGEASQKQEFSFSQKYGQESGRLLFAVEDLLHSTKEQLFEAEQHSSRATAIMKAVASERLAADDQVFEALEKLTPKVSQIKALPVDSSTIDKWTRALASLRVLEAKAHLDANLRGFGDRNGDVSDTSSPALKVEMEDLQTELHTLREEIESVVQMVIGHEIRDPLLKRLQSLEGHRRETRNGWSSYLLSTLKHLVAQLEAMNDQITDIRSYNSVLGELQSMLLATESDITNHQTQQDDDANRSIGSNGAGGKLRPAAEISAPSTAASQVLRRFCPGFTESRDPGDVAERLDSTTAEAVSRLRAQYAAAVNATLENLSKSLGEKQQDFQAITDQLYINSPYNSVHLGERDSEAKLGKLNRSVDELAPKVARADHR